MGDLERLTARVGELVAEAEHNAGPSPSAGGGGNWSDWHWKRRAEFDRVAGILTDSEGARINQKWDGARIRLGGIASSSTSGMQGALTNWLTAARKKLEADHG